MVNRSSYLFIQTVVLDFSCRICEKQDCKERRHNFEKKIEWTLEKIQQDQKASIIKYLLFHRIGYENNYNLEKKSLVRSRA
jgi:hypothetical protein